VSASAAPVITLVVARADNGVIGRDGGLPWYLPADLRHFKALTLGKPIVMGRRTFDSIGRPLPGRHNIVLTRSDWTTDGVTAVAGLTAALAAAGAVTEIAIIGGAAVYAAALPFAWRVYLTEVHATPAGDTMLPAFDPAVWLETARDDHAGDGDGPGYSFVTLERR
jgi:dihydrofolate reductase